MALLSGMLVWIVTGSVTELLGGQFFSGLVFVWGGFLAAVTAGIVASMQSE